MRICQKNVARASKRRLYIAFLSVHEEDTPTRGASIGVGLKNWFVQYDVHCSATPKGASIVTARKTFLITHCRIAKIFNFLEQVFCAVADCW
jgi:hypothetical protein